MGRSAAKKPRVATVVRFNARGGAPAPSSKGSSQATTPTSLSDRFSSIYKQGTSQRSPRDVTARLGPQVGANGSRVVKPLASGSFVAQPKRGSGVLGRLATTSVAKGAGKRGSPARTRRNGGGGAMMVDGAAAPGSGAGGRRRSGGKGAGAALSPAAISNQLKDARRNGGDVAMGGTGKSPRRPGQSRSGRGRRSGRSSPDRPRMNAEQLDAQIESYMMENPDYAAAAPAPVGNTASDAPM